MSGMKRGCTPRCVVVGRAVAADAGVATVRPRVSSSGRLRRWRWRRAGGCPAVSASRVAFTMPMTCRTIVWPWHLRGTQWHTPRSCSPASTRRAIVDAALCLSSADASAVAPRGCTCAAAAACGTVVRPCQTASKPSHTLLRRDSSVIGRKLPNVGCDPSIQMSSVRCSKPTASALASTKHPDTAGEPRSIVGS